MGAAMGSAIGKWWWTRVSGMVCGALFGVGIAVMAAMSWTNPCGPGRGSGMRWPYPDIWGLSPQVIRLAELKYGLAITACGALIGLFAGPSPTLVALGQALRALGSRALAAIRYVTRPRLTFLD